jgi:hypothetical protein
MKNAMLSLDKKHIEELVLQKKMDEEYRAALREREKVLQDAVNKLRKGGAEGIDALDIIKERRANNQAIISSKTKQEISS